MVSVRAPYSNARSSASCDNDGVKPGSASMTASQPVARSRSANNSRGLGRDEIHQGGVELGAAAFPGDGDRPAITGGALMDLDDIGEGDDPGRKQQPLALRAVRD